MRQPSTAAAAVLQKHQPISPPQVGPDGRDRQAFGGVLISNNRQTGCLCCQRKRNVTGETTPHDKPISSTVLVAQPLLHHWNPSCSMPEQLFWHTAAVDVIQIKCNNTKDRNTHQTQAQKPIPTHTNHSRQSPTKA
jgi:hypothetical protein